MTRKIESYEDFVQQWDETIAFYVNRAWITVFTGLVILLPTMVYLVIQLLVYTMKF